MRDVDTGRTASTLLNRAEQPTEAQKATVGRRVRWCHMRAVWIRVVTQSMCLVGSALWLSWTERVCCLGVGAPLA